MILSKKEFAVLIGVAEKNLPVYYSEDRRKFAYVAESTGPNACIECSEPINAAFIRQRIGNMVKKRHDVNWELVERIGFVDLLPSSSKVAEVVPVENTEFKIEPSKPKGVSARYTPEIVEIKPDPPTLPVQQQVTQVNVAISNKNENNINDFEINTRIKLLEEEKIKEEIIEKRVKNGKSTRELVPMAAVTPFVVASNKAWVDALKNNFDALLVNWQDAIKDIGILPPETVANMRKKLIDTVNKIADEQESILTTEIDKIARTFAEKKEVGEKK
jgi:hypothetical protein